MSKPEIVIDLDSPEGLSPFRAVGLLSSLKATASYHQKMDCRHPLGIYNLSTTRIIRKLNKCAECLEALYLSSSIVYDLRKDREKLNCVIDYLELSLYAAAEHVDDIEYIASCFYSTNNSFNKAAPVNALKKEMKPIRDRVSGFINAIKHGHSRIRMFSVDFSQPPKQVCLHGFFIEKFHNGAVAPSPAFHSSGEQIISVTAFLWNIVTYLFSMSDALCTFLTKIDAVDAASISNSDLTLLHRCIVSLARLPLYSFDDKHPFMGVRVVIRGSDIAQDRLKSGIYGSISDRWSKFSAAQVGQSEMSYEGDGTSREFRLIAPRAIAISHWD